MALTFTIQPGPQTNSPGRSIRSEKVAGGGMTFCHVEMTTTTGVGGADYTTGGQGFPIRANAGKFGMRNVYFVIGLSAQNGSAADLSANTMFTFDHVNGKLRCWRGSGTNGPWTEEAGAAVNANSKIQFLAIGV